MFDVVNAWMLLIMFEWVRNVFRMVSENVVASSDRF